MSSTRHATVPAPDDRLLEAMLARRAAGTVPHDLGTGIRAGVARTRQRPSLGAILPAPAARAAWVLVAAALVTLLMGVALLAGAGRSREPIPVRPAVAPVEESAPRPLPYGGERISGTWTYLATVPSSNPAHAGLSTFRVTADQPWASGDGTYDFALRLVGDVGPTTGTLTVTNADGAWSGQCTGANWPIGDVTSVALACWLDGSGAWEGATLYLQMLGGSDVPMRVDGIVYPGGPPPKEEPS